MLPATFHDKKIFNAGMIGGISRGTAADVLQVVPLISMDKDGNASIHGQSANILIDGKPSPYSDVATTLQMISATMINKVEVIPNPDYHAGSDLSYRATLWRLYGNINYHDRETRSVQETNQEFYNPSFHSVTENEQNLRHDHDLDNRLGLDLYLSDRTTLSVTAFLAYPDHRRTDHYRPA